VDGTRSPSTGRSRFVVAAIAALVGLVWVLQGVGVLPGSFMTGDMLWAWIGLGLIGVAVVYAAWPRLRRP
jgi:carbonic anhydrase/acetyltransferase-like protein (isoleucine patch superfamily)